MILIINGERHDEPGNAVSYSRVITLAGFPAHQRPVVTFAYQLTDRPMRGPLKYPEILAILPERVSFTVKAT